MAEQVITTAGQPATPEQPAVFIAGNRKLDKIQLENNLSRHFDAFVDAYQQQWGPQNTQEVRQAYSNMINAIHDDKVSMNIDGSLQISDGSIVNTPNKKGFDPNAAVAYFVKRVSDITSDITETKPKAKKYTGNTFRGNFIKSLSPIGDQLSDQWWTDNWLNLDPETKDDAGNRSRTYANRLKVFQQFLDKEIENLNNYTEAGEEYGDMDTIKQRMLDLKQRLADGEISAEDNLALSRLGFEPRMFTTDVTPLTEEEKAAQEKAQAEAEAEEAAAAAKAEEERRSNIGVLNVVGGLTNKDSATNSSGYANYLATTYGIGEQGFNKINQTIEGLLNKAYQGSLQGVVGLDQNERRQLGNFIHFIRTNNPAYQNAQLTQEELTELQSHKNFTGGNVFKLPWKTQDGRSIYADNAGKIYFLKPANHKELASQLQATGNQYKQEFLKGTNYGEETQRTLAQEAEHNREIFKDLSSQDIVELSSIIPDIASIIDPEPFSAAGLALAGAGMRHGADAYRPGNNGLSNIGSHLLDYGIAAVSALPIAGDAALAWRVYNNIKKFLPVLLLGATAYQSPEMIASVKKAIDKGPTSLTLDDWRNIQQVITLGIGAGRAKMSKNREAAIVKAKGGDQKIGKVQVTDGTTTKTVEVPTEKLKKVQEEFKKAGNDNKAKAETIKREIPEKLEGLDTEKLSVVAESSWRNGRFRPNVLGKTTGITTEPSTSNTNNLAETLANLRQGNWYRKLQAQGIENSERFRAWTNGSETSGSKWWNPWRNIEQSSNNQNAAQNTTQNNSSNSSTSAVESMPEIWRNTFDPNMKNFTKNMERHYKQAKPGLTPAEIAFIDNVKNNWKTASKEDKLRLANMILQGQNRVKAQQLANQRQKAESGGTKSSEDIPRVSEERAERSSGIDGIPEADKIISENVSTRINTPGKETYLLEHNGKYFLWRRDRGYIGSVEQAYGLEINLDAKVNGKTIRELLGKDVPSSKKGGKLQQLLAFKKQGGILRAQKGIQLNPETSWYTHVFTPYKNHILEQLKKNPQYAVWLNEMQDQHAGLYKAAGNDFLNNVYSDNSVKEYQDKYLRDPQDQTRALGEYGYNLGISNANANKRYIREGKRVGQDFQTSGFVPDGWYSGETDDRRILGRLNTNGSDFSDEQLVGFQSELKNVGMHLYLDPSNNYYKLGKLGSNGELLDLNGNPIPTSNPSTTNNPNTITNNPNTPSTVNGTTNQDGNPNPPSLATPGINGSTVIGNKQAGIDKYRKQEYLPELLNIGLGVSSMLGHIATTNKNYKTAVSALRKLRLLDYPQKYHQVVDDYAGNQVANNLASQVRNRANKVVSSDKSFNEAKALEGENKAIDIINKQSVQDQKVRQQHALISEQYGNENHAARIDTGNKNGQLMYDLEQKLANANQSKTLANWTSINNWISEQRFRNQQLIDEHKAIAENWKAQRLGGRNAWINRRLQMDAQYLKALDDYNTINKNPDATQEEKLAAVNKVKQRIAEIQLEAGRSWDQEYARLYGLPYYDYNDPFEERMGIYQRTTAPKAILKKGGSIDAQVQALRSINSRANSLDITEREKLRARKADADRFMKSIWKALDMYMQQTKNLNKK